MSSNGFSQIIFENIRTEILRNHPKASPKNNDKYLQKLTCPVCEKEEAWTYFEKPLSIICPRANHCGIITPIKELYPTCFSDFSKRFPTSKKEPHATATAYLISRGLEPSQIEFNQGKIFDEETKKEYPTVQFKVDKEVFFHRLIDYSGKNKTRIFGSYKGKIWKPKSFDFEKKTWIVESILDALSLIQSGLQAIATLSSSHLPEEFYSEKTFSKTPVVLAFDADNAGKKATEKHILFFKKIKKENYEVAIPPYGKDWNDLLLFDALSKENLVSTIEKALWYGRLSQASSPEYYFQIYYEKNKNSSAIFEFRHQLFKGSVKEKENHVEFSAFRLADCSIDILYSLEDDSIQYQSKTKHRLCLFSSREGKNIIEFSSEELSNLNLFRSKITHYRQTFFGNSQDLLHTTNYLFNKRTPKIRQCHTLGFDRKSDCFVFSKFLYNPQGNRFQINKEGYFEKQKVAPFREKTIEDLVEMKPKEFLEVLFQAYFYRGFVALGFWVSSLFSHLIFDKFGFFPFLSMYGDSRCGKSDLTKMLNRCFFLDWEGISMTRANTQKGELRKISQKSSLVSPMLEGRKDKSRFDYDSILTAYNRNSTQIRAKNTNDNETHELPFESTLAFIQNQEQFTSKASKERVISILFREDDLTEQSYKAWQKLSEYSPEQLAYFGHLILQQRNFFQKSFLSEIQEASNSFQSAGIKIDRIAKNHAIVFAGIKLVCEIFKSEINQKALFEYFCELAQTKIETARTEHLLADYFLECLTRNKQSIYGELNNGGYLIKDKELIIHMSTALKAISDKLGESWNKTELFEGLKQHDKFIKLGSRRVFGEVLRCWIFRE